MSTVRILGWGAALGAVLTVACGLLTVACGLMTVACAPARTSSSEGGGAALLTNLLRTPAIDVVVPAGVLEERCALRAAQVARPGEPPLRVVTQPDQCLRDHARVVIGTMAEAHVRHLAARLGVAPAAPQGFQYQGLVLDRASDALIATFEDPERPGLPVTLFLGNEPASLARDLGAALWGWKPALCVWREGELALQVPLQPDGRCIESRLVKRNARRIALRQEQLPLPDNAHGFRGTRAARVSEARARDYCARAAAALRRAAAWAAPEADADPLAEFAPVLELVLHADAESLAEWSGAGGFAHWNAHTRTAHVLLAPGAPDDGGAVLARAWVERRLGAPVEAWVAEAAGVAAAQQYLGADLLAWQGRMARGGRTFALAELCSARADLDHSPHVVAPLRALCFALLGERRGAGGLRALWSGTETLVPDAELQRAFDERLTTLLRTLPASPARQLPAAPLVGLDVAPPRGAQPGYGGARLVSSLAAARDVGATALSFSARLSVRAAPPARAGPGPERRFETQGGDAALFAALGAAREAGCATLLGAQVLSSDSGTWSGTWVRGSEREWRAHFAQQARCVEHFAALAELAGVDVLSVGSGLFETTRLRLVGPRSNPDEPAWKRAGWTEVLLAARGVYDGALTYCAGSAEELAEVGFWGELDCVALEPRVAPRSHASARGEREQVFLEDFAASLQSAVAGARAADKPLLLLGVSVPEPDPSTAGAVERQRRARLCAVLEREAAAAPGVLQGVFLGRWSSDLDDTGFGSRDHRLDAQRDGALLRTTLAELATLIQRRR